MNIVNRSFSKSEKTLLVILGIIIVGALYFLLIYQPVTTETQQLNSSAEDLENQLMVLNTKVAQIRSMQDSIKESEGNGHIISTMPSYSAGKAELDFLNTTLAASEDYYVGFDNITRKGNQIRREFALKFTVSEFAKAEDIIKTLEHSELRCLISSFEVKPVENEASVDQDEIEVSCYATFYETMYNGVPDAQLPPDSAPQDEEVIGTYEYEGGL